MPDPVMALSGPLPIYHFAPYHRNTALGGPIFVNLESPDTSRTRTSALTGPVYIDMPKPGHFIYNFDADFFEFGGSRSVTNDSMTIGSVNLPASLGLSDLIYHYRPGTKGNIENSPPNVGYNGVEVSVGTGELVFENGGVKTSPAVDANHAYFTGGGPYVDHVLIDAANDQHSGIIGAWINLSAIDVDQTIVWGHDDQNFGFIPVGSSIAVKFEDVGVTRGMRVIARSVTGGDWTFDLVNWVADMDDIVTDQWIQLLVEFGWVNEYDPTYDTVMDRGIVRVYINGKWHYEGRHGLERGQGYVAPPKLGGDMFTDPAFMSHCYLDFSNEHVPRHPMQGLADEIFAAREGLTIAGDRKPMMISTAATWPEVNPEWEEGDEELFSVSRFPDTSVVGYDHTSLIAYGPVEDSGMGEEAGIDRIKGKFHIDGDTTGQNIFVSIRAHTEEFDPDDETIEWGSWYSLLEINNELQTTAGGGAGNWVQVRVKYWPNNTTHNAPVLDRLDIWTEPVANTEAEEDITASIDLDPNQVRSDILGQVFVQHSVTSNFLAKIKKQDAAPLDDVSAELVIVEQAFSNPKAKIFVRQILEHDIPSRIELPGSGDVDEFILSRLEIVRYSVTTPIIPGEMIVKQWVQVDVPATVFYDAWLIPSIIIVKSTVQTNNIPSRVYVRPDVPSMVEVTVNVPVGEWQDETDIVFEWEEAVSATTPVDAYYYLLDNTPGTQVDSIWANTTNLTKSYDLASSGYGVGKWYFHIAARNTAGNFGPTSHTAVFYNNLPTVPGTVYMTINSADTILLNPIVSSTSTTNRFDWNASTDPDPGETATIKYQLQIASRDDFGIDPSTNGTSIRISVDNLSTNHWYLNPPIESGQWFWRIRSFDGKQYSAWSVVGNFRLNAAPGQPTGLLVEDY